MPSIIDILLLPGLTLVVIALTTRYFSGQVSIIEEKPPSVPHWLPWIGNGIEFTLARRWFLENARNSRGHRCFSFLSFGKVYHVVYSPQDQQTILEAVSSNLGEVHPKGAAIACGVSNYSQLQNSNIPSASSLTFLQSFSKDRSKGDMVDRMVRGLQNMLPQFVSFMPSIVDQSPWERDSIEVKETSEGTEAVEVEIIPFARKFLGHAITPIITGSAFVETYSDLFTDFELFKAGFKLMSMGLPRWLPIPRLTTAHIRRRRLLEKLSAFEAALDKTISGQAAGSEWSEMTDVAPALIECCKMYRENSMPIKMRAALDLRNLWRINLGISDLAANALSRIINTGNLAVVIRVETTNYARATQSEATLGIAEPPRLQLDVQKLAHECPLLRSCILETIRLDTFPVLTGKLDGDENVFGFRFFHDDRKGVSYQLKKGDNVIFAPGLQYSDSLFVQRSDTWDPYRFMAEDLPVKDMGDMILATWEGSHRWGGDYIKTAPGEEVSFMYQQCLAFIAGVLALWDTEPVVESGPMAGITTTGPRVRITRRHLLPEAAQ